MNPKNEKNIIYKYRDSEGQIHYESHEKLSRINPEIIMNLYEETI